MQHIIKEIGTKANNMGMVLSNFLTVTNTLENGRIAKCMEKEYFITKTARGLMDNGAMESK